MLRVGLGRHIGSPQADSPQSVSRHIDLHQTREMPNGVVRRGLDAAARLAKGGGDPPHLGVRQTRISRLRLTAHRHDPLLSETSEMLQTRRLRQAANLSQLANRHLAFGDLAQHHQPLSLRQTTRRPILRPAEPRSQAARSSLSQTRRTSGPARSGIGWPSYPRSLKIGLSQRLPVSLAAIFPGSPELLQLGHFCQSLRMVSAGRAKRHNVSRGHLSLFSG